MSKNSKGKSKKDKAELTMLNEEELKLLEGKYININ